MMVLMSLMFSALKVACVVCGVFPFFLAGWIGCLFWLKVRRKWLWGSVSLPIYLLLMMVLFVGGGLYLTRPAGVYAYTLGTPPPAGVSDIQSSASVNGGDRQVHLKFKVRKPADLQTVTQGYERIKPVVTNGVVVVPEGPAWWTPPARCDRYMDERSRLGFKFEERIIFYDQAGGEVYFRFTWNDGAPFSAPWL
jgi:hypothetical protein